MTVQSEAWHAVEHACFLGSGFLFWWPVVQPWPSVPRWPQWSILVYLFLATLPCDILSGFLVFSDRVAYPVYLSAPRHFGLWLLWGIVFLWQFPHFMAIAWMYREDYARAGYMVLPLGEKRDRFVTWQTSLASLALLPVALIPMSLGVSGPAYYAGRFALGAIFLYYGIRFALRKSNAAARDLLVASILYLPLLFALLILSVK